ncbi:hypothetical protein [Microbulbifer agarilyticus]|nr:hypothetical protein [Microbulbifer agarilyticus]
MFKVSKNEAASRAEYTEKKTLDSEVVKNDFRRSILENALFNFERREYDCDLIDVIFSDELDGYSHAHFYRGIAYYKGICIPEDLVLAYSEFHTGAQLGHLDSSYFMALMAYSGIGVSQDVDYANKVFSVLLRFGHKRTVVLMEKLKKHGVVNELLLKNLMEEWVDNSAVIGNK